MAKDSWFQHKFTQSQTYSNRVSSNVKYGLASIIHTTNGASPADDQWRSYTFMDFEDFFSHIIVEKHYHSMIIYLLFSKETV